jgi:hypothetical protein
VRAAGLPYYDYVNSGQLKSERRKSDRFPIEREIRYRVLSKRTNQDAGTGRTVNMSSSGLLFTTDRMLLPGRRLEVSVSWPVQLDHKCALKLIARGRVVRCEAGMAALEIQQHEFRTAGAAAAAAHA